MAKKCPSTPPVHKPVTSVKNQLLHKMCGILAKVGMQTECQQNKKDLK
jgi:hypothetical protein